MREPAGEKVEELHPYDEKIRQLTAEKIGRPLIWEAIYEPDKLLARINSTANRKNQIVGKNGRSAADSYESLAMIFQALGTELATESPTGLARELISNPDLTLKRLEAYVKGCLERRGDAPKGVKIERKIVTLEEEPEVSGAAMRRGVTTDVIRQEVQESVGIKVTPATAGKFARQIVADAEKSKCKRAHRRKST